MNTYIIQTAVFTYIQIQTCRVPDVKEEFKDEPEPVKEIKKVDEEKLNKLAERAKTRGTGAKYDAEKKKEEDIKKKKEMEEARKKQDEIDKAIEDEKLRKAEERRKKKK